MRFFGTYPCATPCHSLDPREIANTLQASGNDKELHARQIAAGQKAVREELNNDVFREAFSATSGSGVSVWLPLETACTTTGFEFG